MHPQFNDLLSEELPGFGSLGNARAVPVEMTGGDQRAITTIAKSRTLKAAIGLDAGADDDRVNNIRTSVRGAIESK